MDPLIAIIPAVCCVLVPIVLAIGAFVGFGKKAGPGTEVGGNPDSEESQRSALDGRRLE